MSYEHKMLLYKMYKYYKRKNQQYNQELGQDVHIDTDEVKMYVKER